MTTAPTLSVRIASKTIAATDICSFELVSTDGAALPAFTAGSHIDVQLPGGLTRQYSLCNPPTETHRYLIGVLRDPASRGGSVAMHALQEGQVLQIIAPRNHFALVPGAQRSLLLAGGIGVTPVLCMAEHLAATGADFEMHYATRSRERTAFYERIKASAFSANVQFHFDDGDAGQKLDIAKLLASPQAGTHLYVCGPKGYMDAVLSTARALAWPESQIHYEFFSGEVLKSDADTGFDVKIASSGLVVRVDPEQTITQALELAGVRIQTSCEQGVCGTCLTRVLSGTPDHRDMYLMPEEQEANDQMLPCCSRSKSAVLVLDL